MTNLRIDSDFLRQPPATDSQDHFLLEPEFFTAAIQFAGDASVGRIVGGVVAVQKQKPDFSYPGFPHPQPERISGKVNLESYPFASVLSIRNNGELIGIVVR